MGVDPHKLSATIEVVDAHETVLATGRFGTDQAGYAPMRKAVSRWSERVWAVEGSNGAGRPLAQRLLAAGEHVVDVPAKLSARAQLLDTAHTPEDRRTRRTRGRGGRGPHQRSAGIDLRRRPRGVADARRPPRGADSSQGPDGQPAPPAVVGTDPGQAKKDITTGQAKPILASVRPRDLAGKTRRRLAAEQLAEPMVVEKKIKALTKELKAMVLTRGSRLMDLPGVGPVVAARILADVGGRPVRRPEPVRVLDRDCTPGGLLRRTGPAPALAGWEPEDQPHAPHRRSHPGPARHPRPRLLPTQARRRQDA